MISVLLIFTNTHLARTETATVSIAYMTVGLLLKMNYLQILWIIIITNIPPLKGFLYILKDVSYADQSCIYLIKNTINTVILWNIITI